MPNGQNWLSCNSLDIPKWKVLNLQTYCTLQSTSSNNFLHKFSHGVYCIFQRCLLLCLMLVTSTAAPDTFLLPGFC